VRTPLILGSLAVVQLMAGLVGQLAVLRYVGVGVETDAYIAAQAVPTLLTAVVAASLQSLWLPRFARAADEASVWRSEQANAQGQGLKVLLGLSLPLWLTSAYWVFLLFPGFSTAQQGLVVSLGGPLFAAAVLNGHSGLLTAGLRANGRFFVAEVTSLAGTMLSLLMIFLLVPRIGIVAAPWIAAARAAAVCTALMWQAGWPGMLLRSGPASREVAAQVRPLVSGGLFIKSGPLVDRYWGSQAGSGGVTMLSVAQLAMNALASILERALLVQTLPNFAKLLNDGRLADLRQTYLLCLQRILLAVVAVTMGLVALRLVWDMLFERLLHMSPDAAWQVWLMCMLLLPSLFVSIAGSAAVAVFYAFGETRLPTAIGVAGILASLVVKAVLFVQFGVVGIAAGASLCLTLNMVCYHVAVMRRISSAAAP
jgi:peptidoglycan biosynthesis protein MviN/MurJ (putative lipid II flippase)